MFSAIIQSTGKILSIDLTGTTKTIRLRSTISSGLKIDQSIAHDGASLTITSLDSETHTVDVVRETQLKTTFDNIRIGQVVNLEKSVTLNSLLDGHLVQGHVDTTLECLQVRDENGSWNFKFSLPKEYNPLVIPHGSICLNGISLTIANLFDDSFDVAIIPYTYANTNFQFLQAGDKVNVEFDLIGKYLLRQKTI